MLIAGLARLVSPSSRDPGPCFADRAVPSLLRRRPPRAPDCTSGLELARSRDLVPLVPLDRCTHR